VIWATNEALPVSLKTGCILDISVWGREIAVHFVSLKYTMMMKGPVRETIRIASQQVQIHIPWSAGKGGKAISGHEIRVEQNRRELYSVQSSPISVHEVIASDLILQTT
jgi:hypothetical protein